MLVNLDYGALELDLKECDQPISQNICVSPHVNQSPVLGLAMTLFNLFVV